MARLGKELKDCLRHFGRRERPGQGGEGQGQVLYGIEGLCDIDFECSG